MRVIFAGTPDVAVPTFRALVEGPHEVVAAVTMPDARGKRGKTLHPSPVKEYAESVGIPVLTPLKASNEDFVGAVRDLNADVAAVVAYGKILRPALLDALPYGWINLHFSLLPAWRGAAPVQRSLMSGDEVTGASTFLIEEGLDTGPVFGTLTELIRPTDTSGDLLSRLAEAGASLMTATLDAIESGAASPIAQGIDGVSIAPKLQREDAYVHWDMPAHVVDRQIRACTPAPGAWTTLPDGTTAKLGPASPRPDAPQAPAGTVSFIDGEVLVASGTHPLALSTISPAGKRVMDAAEWWRGARLPEGAMVGEA